MEVCRHLHPFWLLEPGALTWPHPQPPFYRISLAFQASLNAALRDRNRYQSYRSSPSNSKYSVHACRTTSVQAASLLENTTTDHHLTLAQLPLRES